MPRKPNTTGDRYNDVFPSRLRSLIEQNGTRQEELVEVLGVKARQSVTGYTDGSTMPTLDKIVALAEFFNVSADYLLGLTDVKSPAQDLRSICEYTGLSEDAVKALHCNASATRHEAISYFLENERYVSHLATYLWSFVAKAVDASKYSCIPVRRDFGPFYSDVMYSRLVKLLPEMAQGFKAAAEKKPVLLDRALRDYLKGYIDLRFALISADDDTLCSAFDMPPAHDIWNAPNDDYPAEADLRAEYEEPDDPSEFYDHPEEYLDTLRNFLWWLAEERKATHGNNSEENE